MASNPEKTITRAKNLSFEIQKDKEGKDFLNVQFQVPIPDTPPEKNRIKEINFLSKIIIEKFNIMSAYTEIEGVNNALSFHIAFERLLIYTRIGLLLAAATYYRRCKYTKKLTGRSTFFRMIGFLSIEAIFLLFASSFNNNLYELYLNELLNTDNNEEKNNFYQYKTSKNVNLTFVEPEKELKKL